MIDWKDLQNMVNEEGMINDMMNMLVGAIITSNDITEKPSSIVLLKKYSDFLNVFDKIRTLNCCATISTI